MASLSHMMASTLEGYILLLSGRWMFFLPVVSSVQFVHVLLLAVLIVYPLLTRAASMLLVLTALLDLLGWTMPSTSRWTVLLTAFLH